jgi:hypothetical protein
VKEFSKGIDSDPGKLLHYLSGITGEIITINFFGNDLKNVSLNGQSIKSEFHCILTELG